MSINRSNTTARGKASKVKRVWIDGVGYSSTDLGRTWTNAEGNVVELVQNSDGTWSVAEVAEVATTVQVTITPEVIAALAVLRGTYLEPDASDAFNVLDNAGIFAAIDEATGYDTNGCTCPPSYAANDHHETWCPKAPVSKCTCPRRYATTQTPLGSDMHAQGCPGDPAEWGDMAYTSVSEAPTGYGVLYRETGAEGKVGYLEVPTALTGPEAVGAVHNLYDGRRTTTIAVRPLPWNQ